MDSFNQDVIRPLQHNLKPGERIIYYPNSRGNNDYLANYITPELDAWSYNVGGDKALAISLPQMPADIVNLLKADDNVKNIPIVSGSYMKTALEKGLVDKIIVPTFDLRWDSYSWPPKSSVARTYAQQAITSAKAAGLSVVTSDNFYIVSLDK
jgi:hypothetical protein